MNPALLVIFFAISSVMIYSFVLFDRLVRLEYEHYRKEWFADGEPVGMMWSPADWQHSGSWWARNRVMYSWLFRTPEWITESGNLELLISYRIYSCAGQAMLLVFGIIWFFTR